MRERGAEMRLHQKMTGEAFQPPTVTLDYLAQTQAARHEGAGTREAAHESLRQYFQ